MGKAVIDIYNRKNRLVLELERLKTADITERNKLVSQKTKRELAGNWDRKDLIE